MIRTPYPFPSSSFPTVPQRRERWLGALYATLGILAVIGWTFVVLLAWWAGLI